MTLLQSSWLSALSMGTKIGFLVVRNCCHTDSILPFMQREQCLDRLSLESILLAKPAGVGCSVCSYIYLHRLTKYIQRQPFKEGFQGTRGSCQFYVYFPKTKYAHAWELYFLCRSWPSCELSKKYPVFLRLNAVATIYFITWFTFAIIQEWPLIKDSVYFVQHEVPNLHQSQCLRYFAQVHHQQCD